MLRQVFKVALALPGLLLLAAAPAGGQILLSGRVLAPSGQGLAGARIELTPYGVGFPVTVVATALADADGRFRLHAPSEGMWVARAEAEGFVPREIHLAPLVAAAELPAAELPYDTGLVVQVLDPGGRPAGGARVAAAVPPAAGWRPVPWRARTDDRGELRRSWSVEDVLVLRAYREGFVESEAAVPERQEDEVSALVLRLRDGRPRALVVTSTDGTRLPGVWARVGAGGFPAGRTDEAGRLSVVVPEADPLVLSLEAGDGRRGRAVVPFARAPATIELRPPVTLLGRVTARDGRQPVAGAVVWHRDDLARFTHSDAEGRYRLVVAGGRRAQPAAALAAAAPGYRDGELRLEPGAPARSAFGRVLDDDEQPLPGVEVSFLPEGERTPSACVPEKGPVTTGDDGTFRFSAVCAGTFRLTARAPGFAPLAVPGLTVPAADGRADLREPWDLGTLILTRGSRLTGRVIDRDEVPVAGAELTAWTDLGRTPPPSATSDDDGRFTFTGLPVNVRVDLTVRAAGYALTEVDGVEAGDEALEIVLEAAARLAGRVLGDDGAPIAHAAVRVARRPAGTDPSRHAVTDAEGAFVLDDLGPGEATVGATAEGYLSGPELVIELAAGGELGGVELRLRRGSTLRGRVRSADGEPVANARVESAPHVQGQSDAQGRYRLTGVEPGEQVVTVDHPDFRRRAERIEVRPGANTFDVFLDPGLGVSGRVIGEDGAPLAGARLALRGEGPSSGEARSGADGRFEIGGLVDGTYQLAAQKEGFAPSVLPGGVEVRGAPVAGLEVVLGRGLSITGELLGVELDDLAQVEVSASSPAGLALDGDVRPTGRYRLDGLSPGEWVVAAVVTSTGRRAVVGVELGPGENGRIVDLDLGAGRTFSGRVLVDGQPAAGARLRLHGGVPWAGGTATTGHDGSFRVEGVEPGDYELEITQASAGLRHREPQALTGDEHRTIEITTAHLAGRVAEKASGEPLAGVSLRLEAAEGPVDGLPPRAGTSDADGRFSYRRLTAGAYRLVAEKAGYAPARAVVEVRSGEATETELVLKPAAGLVLRVSRPAGEMTPSVDVALFDAAGQAAVAGTYPVEPGGLVRLGSAPAGSWRLVVSAGGSALAVLPIQVSADPVDVVLEEAAGLRVVIPELEGSALLARIHLTDVRGVPLSLPRRGGALQSQWSLFYGRASVDGLPAGSWSIEVVAADGRTWEGRGTVVAGLSSQVILN